MVPASKKLGKREAAEMARAASRVIVAKGKTISEFRPAGKPASEVVKAMLGPTGRLRAPTIRKGKVVLVGFSEDAYRDALL